MKLTKPYGLKYNHKGIILPTFRHIFLIKIFLCRQTYTIGTERFFFSLCKCSTSYVVSGYQVFHSQVTLITSHLEKALNFYYTLSGFYMLFIINDPWEKLSDKVAFCLIPFNVCPFQPEFSPWVEQWECTWLNSHQVFPNPVTLETSSPHFITIFITYNIFLKSLLNSWSVDQRQFYFIEVLSDSVTGSTLDSQNRSFKLIFPVKPKGNLTFVKWLGVSYFAKGHYLTFH